jgi:hypothetical protein
MPALHVLRLCERQPLLAHRSATERKIHFCIGSNTRRSAALPTPAAKHLQEIENRRSFDSYRILLGPFNLQLFRKAILHAVPEACSDGNHRIYRTDGLGVCFRVHRLLLACAYLVGKRGHKAA